MSLLDIRKSPDYLAQGFYSIFCQLKYYLNKTFKFQHGRKLDVQMIVERSSGGENGNPLQYFCLENSMDRGAWRATVHGVASVRYNLATKLPTTNIPLYIYIPHILYPGLPTWHSSK